MEQDLSRRNVLKLAVGSVLLGFLPSCASNTSKPKPGPILVETKDVHDLNGLIVAIKKAGGDYLPHEVTLEDWYKAFAKSFVENARKAADIGMQIPDWVLEKLPNRKVANYKNEVNPVLITIAILGVVFLVPISLFFVIAFASILTLTRYISEKINEKLT